MAEKTLTKEELKKQLSENEKELATDKKEKEELKKALDKAKKELTEAQLRKEIEIEEETKRRLETAKKKESVDIYVTLIVYDDFNWPGLFQAQKGESVILHQSRFDFLVNKVGNFKMALQTGSIRIK